MDEKLCLEALEWAWTNLNCWLPDSNTMSEEEILKYHADYRNLVSRAIISITGTPPPYLELKDEM
jgi:hypothetical protein